MQNVLTFGKKLVTSHSYKLGTVAIAEMTDTMWAVIAADPEGWVFCSRNFTFTKNCKKEVIQDCKSYYKFVKKCFMEHTLELLEESD